MNLQTTKAKQQIISRALVKYWEKTRKARESPADSLEDTATRKTAARQPKQPALPPKRAPRKSNTVQMPAPLLEQEIESHQANGPQAATQKGVGGK